MRTATLTALALILAALPVAGMAQETATRPAAPVVDFEAADADGSGGISPEEWTAYTATLRSERRAQMLEARVDALIEAADADGDGALSRDELIAGMTAMAEERGERREGWGRGRMGPRAEGGEPGERAEGRRGDRGEMRAQMRHRHGGHHHGAGRGGERGAERGAERGPMGFARIDANGDGQIDAEELAHFQDVMSWMAQRPVRD